MKLSTTFISALIGCFLLVNIPASSAIADSGEENTAWTGPNWDRDLALQAAARFDTSHEAEELLELVRNPAGAAALEALQQIDSRTDWPGPAREATLLQFTNKLRALAPFSIDSEVLDFLISHENQVLVAHEELPTVAVPLFPIRAAAMGLVHQWTRQQARSDAKELAASDPRQLVSLYAASKDPNIRAGIEDAADDVDRLTVKALLEIGMPLLASKPELTGLMGALALKTGDLNVMSRVLSQGAGAALVEVSRQASRRLSGADLDQLMLATIDQAPAATTALLAAEMARQGKDKRDGGNQLLEESERPEFGVTEAEADATIEYWTEQDGVLGLGYPVPLPVDTPLPFDGFRSYNGLHARHQGLMSTNSIVHGEVVGTTHNGREIWAYRIGDSDLLSRDGRLEPATLTNGGIHAREWQTPEVVTGIMELFVEKQGDHHFYDFLLDNVNMVLLPVQNVDGFVQTQRYPDQNWLRSDPFDPENDPQPSPRDGRMRRKNMPGVDEILTTFDDHLFGIDLNRNNPPLWSTNLNRSSPDSRSLVYHGAAPHSEPEAKALVAASELGPASQLRAFTDVHSFSQVFYFHRTSNQRLSRNTIDLLHTMADHNAALPDGSLYLFNTSPYVGIDQGFGMTNEYFTTSLGIPAWGVEVEPSQGQPGFPDNPPGCGADYGGLARNCHDGFILPESQIRRVREELARSFAAAYYQQAGPPSIAAVRFVDSATQAVVFEAEWDPAGEDHRELYVNQVQPLELGRDYTFWVAYDRPMRWREGGEVTRFPGQPSSTLDFFAGAFVGDSSLTSSQDDPRWVNVPGDAPGGYFRYRDDTLAVEFSFPRDETNLGLVTADRPVTLHNSTTNMTGQSLDSDPSTTISWAAGGWAGYEDDSGLANDNGGTDQTIQFTLSPNTQLAPFVVEPGSSAAWYDPDHEGEGFLIEILAGNRAVMYWFTFDETGEQAWYVANGEVRGNRLLFPQIIQTSGGGFGPGFDPDTVVKTVVGSATFLYESCSTGTMVYQLPGRKGRFKLERLSRVMGANCGDFLGPPPTPEASESGSWYNPSQDGHGFVIEVLLNGDVLAYWYTYDQNGNQAWVFGVGVIENGELVIPEAFRTRGPAFGPDFNPDDLELIPWGEMRFDLSCNAGEMSYNSTVAEFGADNIDLERLTALAGLACDN